MADRFPLVANSQTKQIEELAENDNLNLENSSIVGASTITASQFIGNLVGSASSASFLFDGANILSGTINPLRLSGFYNIGVSTANILSNANNILSGTVPRQRLDGEYDISITGTASTANSLTDASNILDGIVPRDRLTGVYNIDITGTAFSAVGAAASVSLANSNIDPDVNFLTFSKFTDGDTSLYTSSDSLTFIPSLNRIGINTSLPISNLHVNGDALITGNTNINIGYINTLNAQNISNLIGIDSTTKSTLENALGFNIGLTTFQNLVVTESTSLNDLSVSGIATIGEITFNSIDSSLNSPQINAFNIAISGISTFNSVSIGSTEIIDSSRNIVNLSGIDTATKSVLVDSLNVGFFEDLSLNGIGTLSGSVLITNGVEISGASNLEDLNVSGISSFSAIEVENLEISGVSTALKYFGDGSSLSGIVTTVVAGIGISLSPSNGKGGVTVSAFRPVGKTIFVSQSGNDSNTGLAENNTKRTIKAAAAIAFPGDTIKVFPGIYVENNPIVLGRGVAVEGAELRNCIVSPQNPELDLFYVNNSVHITDISFQGQESKDGAAIVAFEPLLGVSSDRYFDAARMIRMNLDFIASETVGYLTSTDYKSPAFVVLDSQGNPTDPSNCKDDIKDVLKAVIHDITRGGNSKCVGAGKSYYNGETLQHIVGVKTETIDALKYAAGITRSIINNSPWAAKPVGSQLSVSDALYDNITGITTIVINNHGLSEKDVIEVVGLGFTCPSGPGILNYPSGNFGYTFEVIGVGSTNEFEIQVGTSTLPHTYVSGGTVQKLTNYQNKFTQVKDLSMQPDPETGLNNAVSGCANVVSAIYSCVGVVTTIIDQGLSVLGVGINTNYPGNSGIGFTTIIGITSAVYYNTSGDTVISAPGFYVKKGDTIEVRDLLFECESSGVIGTQRYPSGKYGYLFNVLNVNDDESFTINTGVSTIHHEYIGGGFVVNRAIGVTTAEYDNATGITTITAPGAYVKVGQKVKLQDLEFSCTSGAGTTTLYPSGNLGYEFKVLEVIESGNTFTVNTGVSTIPHTYESGGVVIPPYSPGVGPITQGPYIRNCTNFVPKSIGMRINGFDAEPGDRDDIGVTGSMSVDSYTQYNQGGIGVSISNGAYAQLVSIFTICNDIAIYTESGGQCDLTNSNSSFGTYGLVSEGVGGPESKSIYRMSGTVLNEAPRGQNQVIVSGIGSYRPYDGQAIYFDTLYNVIETITVTDGGSGYTSPPRVTIEAPDGPNGITAQATSTIVNGSVTEITVITNGTQYSTIPNVTISGPSGAGTTATAVVSSVQPIYYTVLESTLPSSGITTISLAQNLNNTVSAGSTSYFSRISLQLTSSHAFEFIGAGNTIEGARPAQGGVTIQENEVIQNNGGLVIYTSTDQAGNFRIGDGVIINQSTGSISGRDFTKALFTTMTPFILALTE